QKMYFSFFKIALFVLPIIVSAENSEQLLSISSQIASGNLCSMIQVNFTAFSNVILVITKYFSYLCAN
ncbi:hypothetical protein, partial [Duncaniella muris]|uniref:hypothetical protein n=1 Tax=Duncaniella muris TaxID=2094150 RepID=UPI0025B75CDA